VLRKYNDPVPGLSTARTQIHTDSLVVRSKLQEMSPDEKE